MRETLAQAWLSLQCQMIPQVASGLMAFTGEGRGALLPAARWPERSDPSADLLAAARAVLAGEMPQPGASHRQTYLAFPLQRNGCLVGVVALQVGPLSQRQRQGVMQLLQWGTVWLDLLMNTRDQCPGASDVLLTESLAAVLGQPGYQAAAERVATLLSRGLACQRVSLGRRRGARVLIEAISHNTDFKPRADLVRYIAAAMEEALERQRPVNWPGEESAGRASAHQHLAEAGAQAVCTLPLGDGFGAMTLERFEGEPLDDDLRARAQAIARLLGPLLALKRDRERGLPGHAAGALAGTAKRLLGAGHWRLKTALFTAVALVGVLTFGQGELRVTAPATLEGSVQRALVAPMDGYVSKAHARAGDEVIAGQVLVEMDDRDLTLERRRLAGERAELEKQSRKAVGSLERAETRILRAQMEQIDSRLALLDEQLARTRLTSPFDGQVISGDLSRSLGAPVRRGEVLLEVAPLRDYRVALAVSDRDVGEVRIGQTGYLVLEAMPAEHVPLRVESVSALTNDQGMPEGFRAEARVVGDTQRLRPGMQGIGKVTVGEASFGRIWGRHLLGWLQLRLWAWLP